MAILVPDEGAAEELLRRRREWGGDRYDEVWEDTYVVAPLAGNEHQRIVGELDGALRSVVGSAGGGAVLPGANVSDRAEDWEKNYRCPDVVVVLDGSRHRCRDMGTHWFGGPDFLVEVAYPGDRTREKLPFYGSIGVRELLIVESDSKELELHRLEGKVLRRVEAEGGALTSRVLPVRFARVEGEGRARLEVTRTDEPGTVWRI